MWPLAPRLGSAVLIVCVATLLGCRGTSERAAIRERVELHPHRTSQAPLKDTLPSGTRLRVRLGKDLSPSESRTGDRFTGVLVEPVQVEGETVLPADATVHGEVTVVQVSSGEDQPAIIEIGFSGVEVDGRVHALDAELLEAGGTRGGAAAVPAGSIITLRLRKPLRIGVERTIEGAPIEISSLPAPRS